MMITLEVKSAEPLSDVEPHDFEVLTNPFSEEANQVGIFDTENNKFLGIYPNYKEAAEMDKLINRRTLIVGLKRLYYELWKPTFVLAIDRLYWC